MIKYCIGNVIRLFIISDIQAVLSDAHCIQVINTEEKSSVKFTADQVMGTSRHLWELKSDVNKCESEKIFTMQMPG